MKLKEKIIQDFKQAFLKREKEIAETLKGFLAVIKNKEIENFKKELEDSQIQQLILKEIKKRKEVILEFEKAKREDLILKEKREIEILQKYLPAMLSSEEIRVIVRKAISELKAGKADFGKIMKKVIEEIKGKAEGKEVNRIVREELEKS